MKNEPKKNSSVIPLVIIVLVLVGVVGGAYLLSKTSKPDANTAANGSTGANQTRPASTVNPNAPQGATPPNMLGSQTASVTVEEFADFQCSACAATHPVMKEIQSTYGSKIRFTFRNYPLPMHDKSYDAATVAEAAGLQGKFWAMQDQLFSNQQSWASAPNYREIWSGYAEKIGLDIAKFQSDVAGLAAKSRVDQDISRAKAMNVSSTPTIFINGQSIPYPEVNVPGLRRIIDAELQKYAASQSATAPAAPAGNASTTAPVGKPSSPAPSASVGNAAPEPSKK
ncbi:MAG TPA: thioredoxin domain-containing protein [Pyrinomonadaceae bacterium]|nr:thioredoxin domain-containing protein [Pyrinomonadaceae bacterium]